MARCSVALRALLVQLRGEPLAERLELLEAALQPGEESLRSRVLLGREIAARELLLHAVDLVLEVLLRPVELRDQVLEPIALAVVTRARIACARIARRRVASGISAICRDRSGRAAQCEQRRRRYHCQASTCTHV